MILYIDATKEHKLELALYAYDGAKKDELTALIEHDKSEQLLKFVDQLMARSSEKITGIIVVKGPQGRFSAIRSGAIHANALAWSFDIPVAGLLQGESLQEALSHCAAGKHFDKSVIPVYEKEPV